MGSHGLLTDAASGHAGEVLSALAALGKGLRTEHLCEAWQRISIMQQQSGTAAVEEQRQLMSMAEQHAASLTGQVKCRTHEHILSGSWGDKPT